MTTVHMHSPSLSIGSPTRYPPGDGTRLPSDVDYILKLLIPSPPPRTSPYVMYNIGTTIYAQWTRQNTWDRQSPVLVWGLLSLWHRSPRSAHVWARQVYTHRGSRHIPDGDIPGTFRAMVANACINLIHLGASRDDTVRQTDWA